LHARLLLTTARAIPTVSQAGRQLTGYRRLQGYRKLSGYRRSLLADDSEAFSGRQLTGYRKLQGYRRSLLAEDSEAAFGGRQLAGYRKLQGYRRSLLSSNAAQVSGWLGGSQRCMQQAGSKPIECLAPGNRLLGQCKCSHSLLVVSMAAQRLTASSA